MLRPITPVFFLILFFVFVPQGTKAASPFTPTLLQDEALWGDGQAEYNFYDAVEVRYGVPRETEVRHILVRENFLPNDMVKANDWQTPGAYPVIKLNQIIRVPTGVYRYDQMHSSFWNVATGDLEKFSLASIDSCGNSYKEGRIANDTLAYQAHTYWQGMDNEQRDADLPPGALFYDELPFKLRLLDWENAKAFTAPLTGSIINSQADALAFTPATFTVTTTPEGNTVTVEHAGGTDTFTFAPTSPYVLRSWTRADGGSLTLTGTTRLDYWNHNAPGDEKLIEAL
jgi:hypothetical protein